MQPRRQARINELIRHAIGEIIDCRLKSQFSGMITITNVKVSPDLSVACVDFTVMGADEKSALMYLKNSRSEITARMAEKIRLRSLPKLKFSLDITAKNAQRIEQLIREINRDE